MSVADPLIQFIEENIDLETVFLSLFPEYERGKNVFCFKGHDNNKPSLQLTRDLDSHLRAFCYGCNFRADNIVELMVAVDELTTAQVKEILYREIVDIVPSPLVDAAHALLMKKAKALEYLEQERNIPLHIIKKFKLGYEAKSKRITIPLYDRFGFCVNIRRMGWTDKHDCKALNSKGKGEARLFPQNLMALERRLILVEGEWDAMVGRAFGLPTITWTRGAGSANEKFLDLFEGKAVWILYDNDKAGHAGTKKMVKALQDVCAFVKVLDPLATEGKDLTDWSFTHPERVAQLSHVIKSFKFPKYKPKNKERICPHCHGTGKLS